MGTKLTLKDILTQLEQRTDYTWLAGQQSIKKSLNFRKAKSGSSSLVGYLNPIHPNQIQLIGKLEYNYLKNLSNKTYSAALDHLFSSQTILISVETSAYVLPGFKQRAKQQNIGLICTEMNNHDLLAELQHIITDYFSDQETWPGVFIEVAGKGVLIQGTPGIGKSEVALELITRGHRLIADDAVDFAHTRPNEVTGSCPGLLQDLLEVRGLGILNIKSLYGDNAIKSKKNLALIIQLVNIDDIEDDGTGASRLHGIHSETKIMGVKFPQSTIPVAPGRNLAVMIEVVVRNHLLKTTGYDAFNVLHERLTQQMNKRHKK